MSVCDYQLLMSAYCDGPKTKRHICATTLILSQSLTPAPVSMSTAMNFSSKSFQPRAPDKGSFPLDHLGECKAFKERFMKCLRDSDFDNSKCRLQSKDYLECRMNRQLMAKEPLEKLGFKDLMDRPSSQTEKDTKP